MTKLTLDQIVDLLQVVNLSKVAEESGVSYTTLTRMSKGSIENPSYANVIAIGEYLEKRFTAIKGE